MACRAREASSISCQAFCSFRLNLLFFSILLQTSSACLHSLCCFLSSSLFSSSCLSFNLATSSFATNLAVAMLLDVNRELLFDVAFEARDRRVCERKAHLLLPSRLSLPCKLTSKLVMLLQTSLKQFFAIFRIFSYDKSLHFCKNIIH